MDLCLCLISPCASLIQINVIADLLCNEPSLHQAR